MGPDPYERYLKHRGVKYPSPGEIDRRYQFAFEGLLVPPGAIRLGVNPNDGRAVFFMPEALSTGLHAVGASETGKTNALKHTAGEFMAHRDRTGEGFSVIDPMGPLARHVLDLCVARGESFAPNVVYFSLRDSGGYVPVFNPLRSDYGIPFTTHSFLEAVAKVRGVEKTTDTPSITEILAKTVKVLLYCGLSLAEAGFFTTHGKQHLAVRNLLLDQVTDDPDLVSFWRDDIGELRSTERRTTISPAGRRFEHILDFPAIKRIVGQNIPGLNLSHLMNRGQIGIFDLGLDGTELTPEAAQLMGALLVQEFKAATMRRPSDISRPHFLMVDEFSNFVSPDVMTVFDQARQKGLRVILAHQGMDQLMLKDEDPRLAKAVLRVRQKLIFGAGLVDDQQLLARQAYAPWIDRNKHRLELRTKIAWPVPKKVTLRSGSEAGVDSVSYPSGSRTHGSSRTQPPGTLDPTTTDSDSYTEPDGPVSAQSRTRNAGWQEGYTTEYEEREQLTSVQFDEAENQLFGKMQDLYQQPTGTCSVVTGKEEPQQCEIPLVAPSGVSDADRQRFLSRVYEKPIYLPVEVATKQIEERRVKLIQAATEPRVMRTPDEPVAGKKLRKPFVPKQPKKP